MRHKTAWLYFYFQFVCINSKETLTTWSIIYVISTILFYSIGCTCAIYYLLWIIFCHLFLWNLLLHLTSTFFEMKTSLYKVNRQLKWISNTSNVLIFSPYVSLPGTITLTHWNEWKTFMRIYLYLWVVFCRRSLSLKNHH